jgi:hypothetical protein
MDASTGSDLKSVANSPQSGEFMSAVLEEFGGMFRFGDGVAAWLVAVCAAAVIALVVVWIEFGGASSPEYARDYEDCVERTGMHSAPDGELSGMMAACNARFAGRRKADGSGYTYYDFMQDKKFDIAGPNPTPEERKAIDREYISYLEGQRREALSTEYARQQNERLRADIEGGHQGTGPPLSLLPANVPLPVPRRVAEQRAKAQRCTEETLSCRLSKLSSAVKDAFASSKTRN